MYGRVVTPEELGAPSPEVLAVEPERRAPLDDRPLREYKKTIITKTVLAGIVAVLLVGTGIAIYVTGDSGSTAEYPFDEVPRGGMDPKVEVPLWTKSTASTTALSMNSTNSTNSNGTSGDGGESRGHLSDDYTDRGADRAGGIPHPADHCQAVQLVNCGSVNSSGWYSTGDNCYRWARHTQCPNNVHSFMNESSCLDACLDGKCSAVKNWTDLRRCRTADKLHQWWFADGRCQLLNNSEAGCLAGDNRFQTEKECNNTCIGSPPEVQHTKERTLRADWLVEGVQYSNYRCQATNTRWLTLHFLHVYLIPVVVSL